MLFPTSLVGSYPQPDWLIDRKRLAGRFPPRVRARELWKIPEADLQEARDIFRRYDDRAGLAFTLAFYVETARLSDQPNESSAAHAKVEVAIATFLKFICIMDDPTPVFRPNRRICLRFSLRQIKTSPYS